MSGLMAGFVFGVIGLWMLSQAKQKARFQLAFIAIALMIYPYLTANAYADWGIGVVLCVLAYFLW